MDKNIGTGKELFNMCRKESGRPVTVRALGTSWDENYCFVIEKIDFWGRPVGTEFMNGKSVRRRRFRIRTLLQIHETRWKKEVFDHYGYTEPQQTKPDTGTPSKTEYPVRSAAQDRPVIKERPVIKDKQQTAFRRTPDISSAADTAAVKKSAEIEKSCRNCRNYKNNSCNGMRRAETCPDYVFMPSASEETKAMWPKEMLASYYRRKDAERHREH